MINYPLEKLLFIDIETVPVNGSYLNLPERMATAWEKKARYLNPDVETDLIQPDVSQAAWEQKAGLFAEFAEVVCVVVGYFKQDEFKTEILLSDGNEAPETDLLLRLSAILDKSGSFVLCGHNIKEFDIPFLCRRYLINGMKIPRKLNFSGKKPWEIDIVDTMELWKFGTYKYFASLELLCGALGIESPKSDMDGSSVAKAFRSGEYDRIGKYCEKDVIATGKVVRKFIEINK